ncbi:ABC transporter permease [Shewanella mesophila]|uniref:ABC transporter permease n=1 Tax=Shewanella mesophila TaxID=2864208 RepID=UPI001C65D564|nr:ABC transporter permease [Shewanella mesophila]QYJ87267.1 ABC transporter permease [Shewanella mesophila]
MLVKLAWRNLWRQKRRTLLTALSLALALFLSLFMRSMQEGSYQHNIDNSARFSTGLVQLSHPDFAQSQSIEDLLPQTDHFISPAMTLPHVSYLLPRIESFALASAGERSKGVMVIGVLPEQEDEYSGIASKLVAGEFITHDDQSVLIGEGLAQTLALSVGDEIVLYGQGYRGQTAAGLYRVKGVLHFPLAALDKQLVYLPLPLAQTLYSTGAQVTTWVLHSDELSRIPALKAELQQLYGQDVNVRDWQELAPEMAQQITMDKAGGVFMMYLLYGIVGFGLFATILMMTLERQREFGVMLATGLQRHKLMQLIIIESCFISLLGVIIGLAVSFPVVGYFYYHPIQLSGDTAEMMLEMGWEPIIPMLISIRLVVDQVTIVLMLMSICLLYPLWRAYHLSLVSALKGGEL